MDVSATKAKTIIDVGAGSKPKSTAEQLMGDFSAAVAERMKMSGQGVAVHRKTNLASALDNKSNAKPEPKADTQVEQFAPRDDHQPRERAEAPEQDRKDSARPVEAKNDAPRENTSQDAPRTETAQNDRSDDAPHQDDTSSNGEQKQSDNASDHKPSSKDEDGVADGGEAVAQTANDQTQTGQGEEVLASVIDMAAKTVTVDGSAPKQSGSEKAQNATAGQPVVSAPTQGGDEGGDLDLAGDTPQKQAKANTAQPQTQANLAQKTDSHHTLNQDGTLKQQQAADIASKVGSEQKMNVNVTVTKQSEQLVSQPTANLGAQAAATNDGNSPSQTAPQTAAKTAAPGPQAAPSHTLGNQAGQQQGSDAQQQAQQQLQMAQAQTAKNTVTTDTKSQGAQTSSIHAANSAVKAGGGEGMSNAPGLTQNTQAQLNHQAAAPHKAAAHPQAQTRAMVSEQVNVQISKAIANGLDKISIQLKPAHLGRIDVHLEMASDGRVSAVVTADNKDTLDMLKQDSRELERAMREAGLQMGSGDLSFNLRENGNQSQGGAETAERGLGSGPLTNEPTLDELLEANAQRPDIISEDRVDITA